MINLILVIFIFQCHGLYFSPSYQSEFAPISEEPGLPKVYLNFTLLQIISLNTKTESLIISGYLEHWYTDLRLKNATVSSSSYLLVPAQELWMPEMTISNGIQTDDNTMFDPNVNALVYTNSGGVSWIPPGVFTTSCDIQMKLFPFDYQKCSIMFSALNLNPDYRLHGLNQKLNLLEFYCRAFYFIKGP